MRLALALVLLALMPAAAAAAPGTVVATFTLDGQGPEGRSAKPLRGGVIHTIEITRSIYSNVDATSYYEIDALYCFEASPDQCSPLPSYSALGPNFRLCTPEKACTDNFLPLNYFAARYGGPAASSFPYSSDHTYSAQFRPPADMYLEVNSPQARNMTKVASAGAYEVEVTEPTAAYAVRAAFRGDTGNDAGIDRISAQFELKGKLTGLKSRTGEEVFPFVARQSFTAAIHNLNVGTDDLLVLKARTDVAARFNDDGGGSALLRAAVTRSNVNGCRKGARFLIGLTPALMTVSPPRGRGCSRFELYMPVRRSNAHYSLKFTPLASAR